MKRIIDIILFSPLYLFFWCIDKKRLHKEIERWYKVLPITKSASIFCDGVWLLSNLSEFRSLLYFRCKVFRFNPILIFYPPMKNLYIPNGQQIGDGLVIQHGFSTIFNCERMGKNCQVWQGVTIGKSRSGKEQPKPVIGDNVRICANAVVIGGITIGDNVTIGAGSVVTKSVPADCVVAGNPARIIKRGGVRCNEQL